MLKFIDTDIARVIYLFTNKKYLQFLGHNSTYNKQDKLIYCFHKYNFPKKESYIWL